MRSDGLESPRAVNSVTMAGSASTYEASSTAMLYAGTPGTLLPWQNDNATLLPVSCIQESVLKREPQTFMGPFRSMRWLSRRTFSGNTWTLFCVNAAGGDEGKIIKTSRMHVLARCLKEGGINVILVDQDERDHVIVGSGAPHRGFNMEENLASAVDYSCTSWIPRAV